MNILAFSADEALLGSLSQVQASPCASARSEVPLGKSSSSMQLNSVTYQLTARVGIGAVLLLAVHCTAPALCAWLAAPAWLVEDVGMLALLLAIFLAGLPLASVAAAAAREEKAPVASASPPSALVARAWRGVRRHWQRRRLYAAWGFDRADAWLTSAATAVATGAQERPLRPRPHARYGLWDWHEVRGAALPTDVVACRVAPELIEHMQRLLEDREWLGASGDDWAAPLPAVPEEC